MIVLSSAPKPQEFLPALVQDVARILLALGCEYEAIFNGYNASRKSVAHRHFHWQVFKKTTPIGELLDSPFAAFEEADSAGSYGASFRGMLRSWFNDAFVWEGPDIAEMTDAAQRVARDIEKRGDIANCVLQPVSEACCRLILFPNRVQFSEILYSLDPHSRAGMSAAEQAGYVVTDTHKLYQGLVGSAYLLESLLREIGGIIPTRETGRRTKRLEEASEEELLSLVPERRRELRKHLLAVKQVACRIAHILGYDGETSFVETLSAICLCHDVGGLLGDRGEDRRFRAIQDEARAAGVKVPGRGREQLRDALMAAGIRVQAEDEDLLDFLDHEGNTLRVLTRSGIVVPDEIKDLLLCQDEDAVTKIQAWPQKLRRLFLCFKIADAFERHNNFYKHCEFDRSDRFPPIEEFCRYLRGCQLYRSLTGDGPLGRLQKAIADGALRSEAEYSRTPAYAMADLKHAIPRSLWGIGEAELAARLV